MEQLPEQESIDPPVVNRIPRSRTHTAFAPEIRPVLTASRGETLIIETQDCLQGQVTGDAATHGHIESSEDLPVTGPVYIEGAEVGDVLCVHILHIALAPAGVAFIRPRTGILGRDIRRSVVRTAVVHKDRITLDEDISLPVHPVVGNIGVASRHGRIAAIYPGRHGGNMDTIDITAGSRVFLPVQVKGALLSLGDVKACMGDGQISGAGVEVAAEVTIRVDTLPGGRFSWPRVKTRDDWVSIASASTVEQASRLAVMEMIRWLEQDKGFDFETAYMLVGLSGALKVSQWSNPLVTARVVFPKAVVKKLPMRVGAPGRTVFFAPAPESDKMEVEEDAVSEGYPPEFEPAEESPVEATGAGGQGDTPGERSGEDKRPRRSRRRRYGSRRKNRKTEDAGPAPDGNQDTGGASVPAAERPEKPDSPGSGQESGAGTPGAPEPAEASPRRRRPPRRRTRRRRSGGPDGPNPSGTGEPGSSEETIQRQPDDEGGL